MSDTFKALVLRQEDKKTIAEIKQLQLSDLPEGDVVVDVDYSSINYKDGLAVTGKGRIILNFPMVPGIDLAGTVVESKSSNYKSGDKVIVTGWEIGERYWGGLGQKARLKSEWLVPMPQALDTKKAMIIGTAGFTAMMSVMALEDAGVTPRSGKVLVTGAGGGVGSIAVALLGKLGYSVTAVTGRTSTHEYLKSLGASEIISRDEMAQDCRPLEKTKWAGVIDTVGNKILARAIAETQRAGAVAACGLAGGFQLPTTVMPFILRGVQLIGIDSVMCPVDRRKAAWARLAADLPEKCYQEITNCVSLEEVPRAAEKILAGTVQGRTLVDLRH